jgi:NADPH-dependent 2,4-dienoyl-CoA reductase/sulfur reductase-like enzyme
MTRLLIIGGSDAGTEAALRARLTDPALEITIVVADAFLNFSICGLPFFVSGEVDEWRSLAHRGESEIADRGIEVLLGHRANAIDVGRQVVDVEAGGRTTTIPYDRLIVATGARPVRPPIAGVDHDGVHVLHTMTDGIELRRRLDQRPPVDAIVIGSGYIGVEMADALTRRGIKVTLVGRAPAVLPTVDPELGGLLRTELEDHGVAVMTGGAVDRIDMHANRLTVRVADGRHVSADVVVLGAGIRPDTELAASAGIALGDTGAIRVSNSMETSAANVFAAGDCVETWHAVLERPGYFPLGTTAHKQGRVAGGNAAGGRVIFRGSVGTQVVKVFDLAAARTGLSEREAETAGFGATTVTTVVPDHKPYYPGARDLSIRVIGDSRTKRLLGVQIVGHWQAEVAKRIDIAAAGLHQQASVPDLCDLDLTYTPPVSSPWDPIQVAADAWDQQVGSTAAV